MSCSPRPCFSACSRPVARRRAARIMWTLLLLLLTATLFDCCRCAHESHKEPNTVPGRSVIVHLFEWRFDDIAEECETFLGPRGYGGVQTSPVNEHGIVFGATDKRPWYERYQPVSYKIGTRSGNETQFRDMVRRCNGAGVRVYVDVVINHMTGALEINKGTAGSTFNYNEFSYPAVPYGPDDFHRKEQCGTKSGGIESYGDAQQVRNCELVGLRDLDHGREHVRAKVAEFLNQLIEFGVAGFRVDAAKHMWPADLQAIYATLDDLNTQFFAPGTKPFIYQEVIDLGHGEPVTRWEYHRLGRVTEFLYGAKLGAVLRKRPDQLLKYLRYFGEDGGFLPGGDAVTFVDNHDNQRGHGAGGADILTFFEPRLYKMATVFLLAWPYGLPRVMSSYRWPRDFQNGVDRNAWFGPPSDAAWNIQRVIRHSNNTCGGGWICEHRWRQIYNLVELHNVAGFSPVTNWWDNGYHAIAFGRGNATFVVINNEDFRLDVILQTSLPPGTYCDVISGVKTSGACTGRSFVVKPDGSVDVTVDNLWDDPVIALHIAAKLDSTA
ncbi:pancreatic alpha-amylase-like [Dermacentor andersoni]|uniref:pancreatic alpha-amylase-like n=1 Tax=Dermacentor andersoni TaxID=34620 RepID=UPI002415CFBD|nr:pancreatic alpha-amylase-like [Dermacentor andersoni]